MKVNLKNIWISNIGKRLFKNSRQSRRLDINCKPCYQDDGIMGFDDKQSSSIRNYIREHYSNSILPYYSYHQQGRLEEYELNALKKKLYGNYETDYMSLGKTNAEVLPETPKIKSEEINSSSKETIPIKITGKELREKTHIRNLSFIQEDGIRGEALHYNLEALKVLKEKAGTKRVINLGYDSERYKEACSENEMEYYKFDFKQGDFWDKDPACKSLDSYVYDNCEGYEFLNPEEFAKRKEKYRFEYKETFRKSMDGIITFIKTIQKGDYYIGCENGQIATSQALLLNKYFNPKNKLNDYNGDFEYSVLVQKGLRGLYRNFTKEDKKELGWTKEFEEKLSKELRIEEFDKFDD